MLIYGGIDDRWCPWLSHQVDKTLTDWYLSVFKCFDTVGLKGIRPVKTEWFGGAGMVICLSGYLLEVDETFTTI